MPDKLSKDEVNYRRSTSSRRCGNCSMFRRDIPLRDSSGHCTLVEGVINARDVCNKWEPNLER